MSTEPGTHQGVERAAAILAAFHDGGQLRVADVAARSGLGQSTTSRLLATLESLEYVERDPATSTYRLGTGLISLTAAALNQHPVFRAGRQPVQELAAVVGLGANLAVAHDWQVFYLANSEGIRAPRSVTLVGRRNPLHATAMGKCLLLGSTGKDRRDALGELAPFNRNTIADHDQLDAELTRVEQVGYATEVEELAFGRACVAAPVRDADGTVVASISISGPLTAINLEERERELSLRVIETADMISVALGYTSPADVAHLTSGREGS